MAAHTFSRLVSFSRHPSQHQAQCLLGGFPVADLAQMGSLHKAREAGGKVAGFFILERA